MNSLNNITNKSLLTSTKIADDNMNVTNESLETIKNLNDTVEIDDETKMVIIVLNILKNT